MRKNINLKKYCEYLIEIYQKVNIKFDDSGIYWQLKSFLDNDKIKDKMELNKLSKDELINLKNEVETALQKVIKKETRKKQLRANKGSILNLKQGDEIFAIRLSFGGHHIVDLDECVGEVDVVGYCVVNSNDLRDDTDDFRIDISHPTECVGFSCTLYKKDYIDEHCLLFMKDFKSGYDAFYTLKPKSWKKDLIRLYHEKLEHVESYHQKVLSLYDSNINIILNAEDKINQYI